jgi:hypothetical protein
LKPHSILTHVHQKLREYRIVIRHRHGLLFCQVIFQVKPVDPKLPVQIGGIREDDSVIGVVCGLGGGVLAVGNEVLFPGK